MGSAGYRVIRALIRLLLWVFYRRIDVVGRERIPSAGPLIVAANHHNAVVDAMLVVATMARPVTVLAKAPLFGHPLLGPFLKLMGAVPVHRRAEAGDDPARNEAMFAAAIAVLRAGGAVLIFPEGRSQPQPLLLPLRTGAARILLATEGAPGGPCGVTLLPIGLVFHDPGTFRSASVLVAVGEPVSAADLVGAYAGQPAEAVRGLTDRLAGAIRDRIVEAEDHHTLELLAVLERAWSEETGVRSGPEQALAWKRQVVRAARHLGEREPHRVAEVRRRVELYRARLEEAGIPSRQLGRPYRTRVVVRYVATNVLWLGLGLPLALSGIACHAAPYWLTGRVVRWLGRGLDEEATDKMAAGLVLYPLFWSVEGWLVWWGLGVPWLAVFALLLAPSGVLALAWHERLDRVGRQARAFVRFVANRGIDRELVEERRMLVATLRDLAERVPGDGRGQAAPPVG